MKNPKPVSPSSKNPAKAEKVLGVKRAVITNRISTQKGSLRVLVACEFSGVVRDAFAALGHDAWSCDLLPSETPGNHFQSDARCHLGKGWDLMIAHPPCTYLANSGVRWLVTGGQCRADYMDRACEFFCRMLDAPIPHICVENPIPHHYAIEGIGDRKYDQIIQPWQFGHGETKATCLWLKNLPKLIPTDIVEGRVARVHRASPGPDRWKECSRTLTGIANSMADQWGSYCEVQRDIARISKELEDCQRITGEDLSVVFNAR